MTKETATSTISTIMDDSKNPLLDSWISHQMAQTNRASGVSDASLKASSTEFYKLFKEAVKSGSDISSPEWTATKQMLTDLSASRALQGSTPTETATFIYSLKQVMFSELAKRNGHGDGMLIEEIMKLSNLLDELGLFTAESYQRTREGIIRRQQKDMLEMSTPVIKLWEGILAVPLIGTLDSARTQIVMETLLQAIVDTGSKIAILDITGVPTVDTQTAQHLMKTVSATRLMGADCIISGIRPQIAQTIVHLGIDIFDITTKATMFEAVKEALDRSGFEVYKIEAEKTR